MAKQFTGESADNLNKENFWNFVADLYPAAMQQFSEWIDRYKEEVHWDTLFCNEGRGVPIKFHLLPFDMQNGILARFDLECYHGRLGVLRIIQNEPTRFRELFADLQDRISEKKK